jgi:hypothetical protein
MNGAFLEKPAQSHVKPAHSLVVKTWRVLVVICHVSHLWKRDGCQRSKMLSYTANFNCEVVYCAEEKGNCKATAVFGVDESNV